MKILIDNEEVVSGKDFTITEEMLNTPSVILNNVYPKIWEKDKDYVSRFYYPKDYSKCLIYDSDENLYPYTVYGKTTQETIEGEEGTTVEGQEISITDYDSSKEHDVLVEGNTTQEGTPTPENPQEIEDVTGLQKVELVGKNLFDKDNVNSLTAYISNSSTTINSTSAGLKLLYIPITGGKTYTISKVSSLVFRVATSINTPAIGVSCTKAIVNENATNITITTPTTANYLLVNYYRSINPADTLTEQQILDSIQVELGSTSTEYEPYKSKTYELNFGKNLFDKDNAIDGFYVTSVPYTNSSWCYYQTSLIPNETYVVNKRTIISFFNGNTHISVVDKKNNTTFTVPANTTKVYLSVQIANKDTIQIEKGSKATSYSPYFTPIHLRSNKDKTVRDYVHKVGNDWFIHRQINEIVLDGSENLVQSGATTSSILVGAYVLTDRGIDGQVISNRFIQGNTVTIGNCNVYNNGGTLSMLVDKTQISDIATLKTWLSSNNAIFYYPLATPTYTKITNEELISQLEELYNDEFFDGVNNISTSGIYLNLHYNYVTPMPSPERPSQMINLTGNVELEIEGNTYRLPLGEKELCSNKDETIRDFIQKDEDDKWYINKRIGIIENYNGEEITTEYMSVTGELTIGTKVQYVLENIEKEEITDETLIRQLESIGNLLIFSGIVKNSGKISLNPRYPHFCDLQILDFKMFLSEVILDFVIANKTIKEAIQQVTSFISSYGFVVGNIELANPNEMIGAYSTKDKSPYDVFNYIADITQSRWTTRMLDQDTVAIDFYNPELMEQGTAIEYTTQWFEDNKIDDISYSYGTYDYRNKQIMTSDEVMANITSSETIIANGYQTQYNTEEKIGKISSIKINGSEVTFTTNTNKELGITAEVYYNPGNQYFETDEPLSTGSVISIEYIAIVKGRQIITNSTEINRVANSTGRNGTLARYENRNDATTSDELQKIGQSYIKYKGTPEIKLNISTRNNIWEIGQKVEFNAPITELSTEYMVKRKDIKYITTIDTIFYTYELTSSFNSEREINYFDNQRAKANGNIGEGEYVPRNIDIENTTNIIFYDSSIEEVEVVGNNILDSVLDSPFNN